MDLGEFVVHSHRGLGRVADDRVLGDGPRDLALVAAEILAVPTQHRVVRRDGVRLAEGVPQVGICGGRPERLARSRTADQDRQSGLHRSRPADRVGHLVEPALVGHGLAIEQPPDQPDRLVQPVQALAEAAAEVDAEGVVLPFEPATTEPEDRPAARDVVERRRELGGQPGVAERVGGHEQAQPHPLGQGRERGQGRPALELGIRPVTLVGEEVIVDP